MHNSANSLQRTPQEKTTQNKLKNLSKLWAVTLTAMLLNITTPSYSKTNYYKHDDIDQNTEQIQDPNLVDIIQQKTWYNVPKEYEWKVKEFVNRSNALNNKFGKQFFIDFFINQLKKDWWISKENQSLFIYYVVFTNLFDEEIYNWEDWDEQRLDEFEKAIDFIEQCWLDFQDWYREYMNNISKQATQRTTDAINEIRNTTLNWLKDLAEFYSIWERDPNIIKDSEIQKSKEYAKYIISNCSEYSIDYKEFRLKQLWSMKRVENLLNLLEIK